MIFIDNSKAFVQQTLLPGKFKLKHFPDQIAGCDAVASVLPVHGAQVRHRARIRGRLD